MNGRILRCWAFASLLGLVATPLAGQDARWSIAGTASVESSGYDNPYVLLAEPGVQQLAEQALTGPLARAQIDRLLSGTGITLRHLTQADVVRPLDGDRFALSFTVITAADKRLIRSVADPAGRRLAAAIVAHRARFDAILSRYDLPRVRRDLVAMAVIGCVILDWDGLDITARLGYRRPPVPKPNGDIFAMTMMENGPGLSVRGLYWGSHNTIVADGAITMTTFGDHENPERYAFPDLTGRISATRLASLVPRHTAGTLAQVLREALARHQEHSARIMTRLRQGPQSEAALSAATSATSEEIRTTLRLLETIRYVERDGDRYLARVPVFTVERDREMLTEARALGAEIVHEWLRQEYPTTRAQLAGLSAVSAGVPFEIMFTQLWHDLFGWTNYHLAREGFFYDPYGPNADFVGFMPFVAETELGLL